MLRLPFLQACCLRASFFAVCLVLSAPSAVLAAPDCAYWTRKDGVDGEAVSAFWKAATSGDVARCLKAGANSKARDEGGWTPLHLAAGSGDADTVTALLKAGANPKARNKGGRRPIDLADEEGKLAGPAYWQLHDASFD